MALTAIWGPPNSGKTTLTVDVAFALSRCGKSVLLISPETYSEMSARLKIRIPSNQSLEEAYRTTGNLKQAVCSVDGLLFVLASSYYADAFDETGSGNTRALLHEAESAFDEVLVDCPSNTSSALAAWSLNQASRVLYLTGLCQAAVLWKRSNQKAIRELADRIIPVCLQGNADYDYRSFNKLLELEPQFWVPFYPDVEHTLSSHRTLIGGSGRVGRSYDSAIQEICNGMMKGGQT